MITFEELESRNFCKKGIGNHPVFGKCCRCKRDYEYTAVKKFLSSRIRCETEKHQWNSCQVCWLKIRTSENPDWKLANSNAQKVAQNKPEQLKKNAEAVSKSWTKERKNAASKELKEKWKDKKFAKKALKNINWTQTNDSRFRDIMSRSIGSGGLKGCYNGLHYESGLELSFIMWCNDKKIPIRRYDLEAIEYKDENNRIRKYVPDFLINSSTIVEIKGSGLFFRKNFKRNIAKIEAMIRLELDYVLFNDKDEQCKSFYRKARKWHHENKIKEKDYLQR
jgi:hypothetical protein